MRRRDGAVSAGRFLTIADLEFLVDLAMVQFSPGGDKLSPHALLAITFLLHEIPKHAGSGNPDSA
jgi:hypothetical protein